MIWSFDNCELDLGRVVLRRDGVDIPIEPQVFDLLTCLIERRGQVVRKEELLDVVWGDRFVSESALTTRIKSARRAIGDDGTNDGLVLGHEAVLVRAVVAVAGQPGHPIGREQPERIPTFGAPRLRHLSPLDDDVLDAPAGEGVAHRQARLTRSDDRDRRLHLVIIGAARRDVVEIT